MIPFFIGYGVGILAMALLWSLVNASQKKKIRKPNQCFDCGELLFRHTVHLGVRTVLLCRECASLPDIKPLEVSNEIKEHYYQKVLNS